MPVPAAPAAPHGYSGYNPPASHVPAIVPVTPRPDGAHDGLVPGFLSLETDIDAFRSVIDCLRYLLANRETFIQPDFDLSLHKLKRKVQLLYPNLEPFSGKDLTELLGIFSSIADAFNGQLLSEGLAPPVSDILPHLICANSLHQRRLSWNPQSYPRSFDMAAPHPFAALPFHHGRRPPQ